jgi:hypothetical protein
MVVAVAVVVVMVVFFRAGFELIHVLSSRRRGTVSRCILRGSLGATMVVAVAVMVVVVFFGASRERFGTFSNGISNNRCNGSSSKNECNRKFNLNHFCIMKV